MADTWMHVGELVFVLDRDGVVTDDVTVKMNNTVGPKSGHTVLGGIYREFSFLAALMYGGQRAMQKLPDIGFDQEAVDFMRFTQSKGVKIRIETSNRRVSKEKDEAALRLLGVNADVRVGVPPNQKGKPKEDGTEIVIGAAEDRPGICLHMLRNGAKTVFAVRRGNYNTIGSAVLSRLRSSDEFRVIDSLSEVKDHVAQQAARWQPQKLHSTA